MTKQQGQSQQDKRQDTDLGQQDRKSSQQSQSGEQRQQGSPQRPSDLSQGSQQGNRDRGQDKSR